MSYAISPYDRQNNFFETNFSLVMLLSVAFHVVFIWLLFFVLPNLMPQRQNNFDDFITVELLGSLAPPAPAAPEAPVNPDLKGPDVVEIPSSTSIPQPPTASPDPTATPTPVIPLGPKPPEKLPEITRSTTPPPTPRPPVVQKDKPKPKPINVDSAINRRMKALERKVAANNSDLAIATRVANLAIASGLGTGEGSTSGGATRGERVHPDEARYYAQIRDLVSSNWVPPGNALDTGLEAIYQITIQPDGRISSSTLSSPSGDQDYDLSVLRAVKKSSPLPALPPIFAGYVQNPVLVFNFRELMQMQQP